MSTFTIEEAKRVAEAMEKQGATQAEVQEAIDHFKKVGSPFAQSAQDPKKDVGLFQGTVQAIAKPFLKTASSVATIVGAPLAGMLGADAERIAQVAEEGIDYGFFGKATSFGTQFLDEELSGGQKVKRAGMELAGNLAEIASYGLAPLKAIKGAGFFETAFKAGAPFSAAFGVGKGLQAGGEGKGAGEAVLEGVGGYLGSSLGYGIFGKGAQLMGTWGARALQSPAIQASGKAIQSLAEKVWTAMPESFKAKGFEMADALINSSTRRAVNALKAEYGQTHKQAVGAWIDATSPNVNNPDLALSSFQRSLSSEIGGMFRKSSSLYDDFKAANPISESVADWGGTNKAIDDIPKNSNLKYFFTGLKQSLSKPTSPRQILSTYEQLMSDLQKVETNEEKTAIREVANSLYSDMRKILEKKDPTLLNKWDEAYQSWKKATDIYESNPMKQLKTTGDVDTIVDKMATKSLTRGEQQTIYNAMKSNPAPVRELVVSSLLRKAQGMEPKEGAKLIRDFLDSWDFKIGGDEVNGFLDPKQALYLDDLASYMEEGFDEFLSGMRKTVGIKDDVTKKLSEEKAQINLAELVDKGDFESISRNWDKITKNQEFTEAIKLLKPDERKLIGGSLWRKMFEENTPLITINENGSVNFEHFANSFKEAFAQMKKVGGGKKADLLEDLYSKSQINDLFKAEKMLKGYENIKELPKGDVKSFVHGVLGVVYSTFGAKYIGAIMRHGVEAVSQPTRREFYRAVDKLIEEGLLNKNLRIKVGDILRLLELPAGALGGQGGSAGADAVVK